MITIQETIKKAISIKGAEILKDRDRLCMLLEDLSPALKEDREFLEKTYSDAVGKLFYEAYRAEAAHKRAYIAEADAYLEEEFGFHEKWRSRLISCFEGIVVPPGQMQRVKSGAGIFKRQESTAPSLKGDENIGTANADRMRDEAYACLWGIGVPQDMGKASRLFEETFKLYQREAKRGDAKAQYWCGFLCDHGIDIKRNLVSLNKWYQTAVNKKGYWDKGKRCLERKTEWGLFESERYFRWIVESGSREKLGRLSDVSETLSDVSELLTDVLSDAHGKRNDKKVFQLYQKAAEQGERRAQYELGCMYLTGRGVKEDIKKGKVLIEKAAVQGYVLAQCHMGNLYGYPAMIGAEKQDYKKAIEWYQKAAAQGDEAAEKNLKRISGQGG